MDFKSPKKRAASKPLTAQKTKRAKAEAKSSFHVELDVRRLTRSHPLQSRLREARRSRPRQQALSPRRKKRARMTSSRRRSMTVLMSMLLSLSS